MSRTSAGLAKWAGTQPREIRVYTARTTVTRGILHNSAGHLEITWNSWLKSNT